MRCVCVGIPGIMASPVDGAPDIFRALINSDDHNIILSDAVRAAIAYKW